MPKGLNLTLLVSILQSYAIYDPVVEYSQGMNYIAALLLHVFNNDAHISLKALVRVVSLFDMG